MEVTDAVTKGPNVCNYAIPNFEEWKPHKENVLMGFLAERVRTQVETNPRTAPHSFMDKENFFDILGSRREAQH